MAALQVPEVVGDGVEVEVGELVVKPRDNVVAEVQVSQVEVYKVLFFPGVHSVLIEPGEQCKVPATL